jgi:chorismate mutase
MVRAIRGATTVKANEKREILDATGELLREMAAQNGIVKEDIVSILFSMTTDLNAVFPAVAAREMGWDRIAMMCSHEIDVPGSLKNCIRILMHVNTDKRNDELRYIYLKEARALRPDLSEQSDCGG